jgi:hypothetical protein
MKGPAACPVIVRLPVLFVPGKVLQTTELAGFKIKLQLKH